MMEMNLEQLDVPVRQEIKKATDTSEIKKNKKVVKKTFSNEEDLKGKEEKAGDIEEKEPSKNSMDAAMSELNRKLAMQDTRCEYRYDEDTNRVAIKIIDKNTDEVIKEIPPEETLESIKKIWEIAGIMLDEKF